jgi:type IV secretory pathway VirB2 component (pilin)
VKRAKPSFEKVPLVAWISAPFANFLQKITGLFKDPAATNLVVNAVICSKFRLIFKNNNDYLPIIFIAASTL